MLLHRAVRAALKDCKAALVSCSEGRLSSEKELVSRSLQSVGSYWFLKRSHRVLSGMFDLMIAYFRPKDSRR